VLDVVASLGRRRCCGHSNADQLLGRAPAQLADPVVVYLAAHSTDVKVGMLECDQTHGRVEHLGHDPVAILREESGVGSYAAQSRSENCASTSTSVGSSRRTRRARLASSDPTQGTPSVGMCHRRREAALLALPNREPASRTGRAVRPHASQPEKSRSEPSSATRERYVAPQSAG
jgi:hypothetical protein